MSSSEKLDQLLLKRRNVLLNLTHAPCTTKAAVDAVMDADTHTSVQFVDPVSTWPSHVTSPTPTRKTREVPPNLRLVLLPPRNDYFLLP